MYDLFKNKIQTKGETQTVAEEPVATPLTPAEEKRKKYNRIYSLICSYVGSLLAIVVGALSLGDCPVQPWIPIGSIVFGSLMMLSLLLTSPYQCRHAFGSGDGETKSTFIAWLDSIVQLVFLGWYITECYWVFSIFYKVDVYDSSSPHYCNYTLYRILFWTCIFGSVVIGLCVLIIIAVILAVICQKEERQIDVIN